jgi:outer membrane receptor protein involved in Fe transport
LPQGPRKASQEGAKRAADKVRDHEDSIDAVACLGDSAHTLRAGVYFGEYGVESDQTSQVFPIVNGQPATNPISLTANLNKINIVFGFYLEDTWKINEQLSVNFGSRWDRVTGLTDASQFSPTINIAYNHARTP